LFESQLEQTDECRYEREPLTVSYSDRDTGGCDRVNQGGRSDVPLEGRQPP